MLFYIVLALILYFIFAQNKEKLTMFKYRTKDYSAHRDKNIFYDNKKMITRKIAEETLCILYYAPWDARNKEILKIWTEFSDYFRNNSKVLVVTIDCSQNENMCKKALINKYPTMRFIRGGRVVDYPYHFPISLENLIQYVTSRSI